MGKKIKLNVGLYVRVSTEEQAENPEGSIKNQKERLKHAVQLKALEGYLIEITDVYIDRAKSGKDTKRAELQRMLKDIKLEKINLVMSSELSRISRSMRDFAEIWELMKKHNCGFQSLRENFDTTTAAGEMVLYSVANIAQFERRQVSERVTANINARAKRGLYNGGSVPIGFKLIKDQPGFLAIDKGQAKVVRSAFKAYLNEESLSQTAKWLNSKGYVIKKHKQGGGSKMRSGLFNVDNLHRMLTNVSYIGKRKYTEKNVIKFAKAVWSPIIDEITFSRVQDKLKKNKSRKKPHSSTRYPYLLSGLTHCMTCGDVMSGKSAHGRREKFGYYEHSWATKKESCITKKTFKCEPHRVPAKKLEPLVLDKVQQLLTNKSFAKKLFEQVKVNSGNNPAKKQELDFKSRVYGVGSQIDALVERLSELPSTVSAEPIYKQLEALEKRKLELSEKLKSLDISKAAAIPANLNDFNKFTESLNLIFAKSDPKFKALVISKLIKKVEIGTDSVRIHYFVGKEYIEWELADKANSKHLEKNIKIKCSNSLTNGAPERT